MRARQVRLLHDLLQLGDLAFEQVRLEWEDDDGDWCAIEPRTLEIAGTGPPAAAANYILAVQAMTQMAAAIGESADAARYGAQLAGWKALFHAAHWHANTSSYTGTQLEVQAISAIALGADAVPPALREQVVRAGMVDDIVARGYHHTIGSTGAKWLLADFHETRVDLT